MSASNPNTQDLPSFEDAIDRLEEIVSSMEEDQLSLEAMVNAYENGARLLKHCRNQIETSRQRVDFITAQLENPEATTLTPFDPVVAESAASEDFARPATARSTSARRSATSSGKTSSTDDEDIRLF